MRTRLGAIADAVSRSARTRLPLLSPDRRPALEAVLAALAVDHDLDTEQVDGDQAPDRLDLIAPVFGLDDVSVGLLAVALAADLDAGIAAAYDLLAPGHDGRPTVSLALELLGVASAEPPAFAYLDPSAPLRRQGLLEVVGDGPWPRRVLRAPDRVSSYAAGVDVPVRAVAAAGVDTLPLPGPEADRIARALDRSRALVWVHSPMGTAGASVAVAGMAAAGLPSLVVDLRHRGSTSCADLVRLASRESGFAAAGLVVVGAEDIAEQTAAERESALDALAAVRVPVVAVGGTAWDPSWRHELALTVDAPVLGADERTALWETALGGDAVTPSVVSSARTRLTPSEVLRAARHAAVLAAVDDQPVAEARMDAVRALGRRAGGSAHGAARTPATFDDLVLPERVITEIRRLVGWAAHRDEAQARGPIHGKGSQAGGLAALFTGGPGTGKTLSAHVIAHELGLELMQVELPAVVDKYIGETEKNLERVFREAEQRNVVLFFDEADALFGSRSEVHDSRDRYANQEVAYLLQRMEHFDGLTLLATNLRGNLDRAFSRRMHFIVHFPDPDEETRRVLWAQLLTNAGELDADDPVDVDALATTGDIAGGDMRNIVLAATYDATTEGVPVGMRHLLAARDREFRKLGRRVQ